jgi:hypothetical protein
MLLLFAFLPSVIPAENPACGTPGFQITVDDESGDFGWEDSQSAHVEHHGTWSENQYYLGLRGSFVASKSGSHTFRLVRGCWEPSDMPPTAFFLEGDEIQIWHTAAVHDRPLDVTQDFRYKLFAYYLDELIATWMEFHIIPPGEGAQIINGDNGGETCEESGCRDTGLSRDPYQCLPSPTPSHTPTSTASLGFVAAPHFAPTAPHQPTQLWAWTEALAQSSDFSSSSGFIASPLPPSGTSFFTSSGRLHYRRRSVICGVLYAWTLVQL